MLEIRKIKLLMPQKLEDELEFVQCSVNNSARHEMKLEDNVIRK